MRIRGRDLQKIIREELSRSMRLSESAIADMPDFLDKQKAADKAVLLRNYGPGGMGTTYIGDYIRTCQSVRKSLSELISAAGIESGTTNVLKNFDDMREYGSKSEISKAVRDTLADPSISSLPDDGQTLAVIAAIQTGKLAHNRGAAGRVMSPGSYIDTLNLGPSGGRAAALEKFKVALRMNAVIKSLMYIADTDINAWVEGSKPSASKSAEPASTVPAAPATKSRAPASSEGERWAKLGRKSAKHAAIIQYWMDFVNGGSATAANGNDGGAYTNSFSDFQKWYTTQKADMGGIELTVDGVLSLLKADTDPEAVSKKTFGDSYIGPG